MSFNLGGYGLADRDGSGQLDDPKPAGARAAVIALIAANRPDILAVQEIGNPLIFGEFRHALQQAGLDYEQAAYLQREHSENNLAVLSRFPITNILMHTHDRYRIGATNLPVTCGFLEVEIRLTPKHSVRLLNAHLKDKEFDPRGQTEMRRNEARLLNNLVRRANRERPDTGLILAVCANDTPDSAAVRELAGNELADLRPADAHGAAWTQWDAVADRYERTDYLFISRDMQKTLIRDSSRALSGSNIWMASDHRPVMAVFRIQGVPDTCGAKK